MIPTDFPYHVKMVGQLRVPETRVNTEDNAEEAGHTNTSKCDICKIRESKHDIF